MTKKELEQEVKKLHECLSRWADTLLKTSIMTTILYKALSEKIGEKRLNEILIETKLDNKNLKEMLAFSKQLLRKE